MAEDDDDSPGPSGLRSFWSGTITFGLVSVPVALFPATRPRSVSLKMVDREGTPLRRRYVCSKDGEDLDNDEIVRGYEVEKGKFVVVEDDELEAIEPRKSREIDLQLFVPVDDIPPRFFERAYYLTPAGGANKAYRLLAEVMEKRRRAGIATFVMRAKEYLIAILAEKGILRAETLRFADELRTPEAIGLPKPVKPKPALVKKIEAEITARSRKLALGELLDDYAERLEAVAEKKEKKGKDVIVADVDEADSEGEGGGEVVDLLAVLSRSLQGGGLRRDRRPAAKSGSRGAGTLEKKTKSQLLAEAKKLAIEGRSSMTKEQLIAAIRKSA